jgi:hypothetical protein
LAAEDLRLPLSLSFISGLQQYHVVPLRIVQYCPWRPPLTIHPDVHDAMAFYRLDCALNVGDFKEHDGLIL